MAKANKPETTEQQDLKRVQLTDLTTQLFDWWIHKLI